MACTVFTVKEFLWLLCRIIDLYRRASQEKKHCQETRHLQLYDSRLLGASNVHYSWVILVWSTMHFPYLSPKSLLRNIHVICICVCDVKPTSSIVLFCGENKKNRSIWECVALNYWIMAVLTRDRVACSGLIACAFTWKG